MGELVRLDVEPHHIPAELYAGFIEQLAGSLNLPLPRTRAAVQRLIDRGIFDTLPDEEDRVHHEREIVRNLLLHDPEIRDVLKTIIAELGAAGK